MHTHAVLISIPGLRSSDLAMMPRLAALGDAGAVVPLSASFPAVTCPVQVNLTTGRLPQDHGVIANGYYWRDRHEPEMWTAWNKEIQAPQIWDLLHEADPALTSAVWFPLLSKGSGADYVCTPAPIHNPDGSESLWCYTKPTELYGELRDTFGHFPLMKFWGPLSSIESTDWIVDSAVHAVHRFKPRFQYIYLPHLDYAAQKHGPDSPEALAALPALDAAIGRLVDGWAANDIQDVLWMVASEYVITPVESVSYPNRQLRDAGLLALRHDNEGRELIDFPTTRAWALVDHQLAHIFVPNSEDIETVANLFRQDPLVKEVLVGEDLARYGINHPHSGEVVLISQPESWFAYYWWLDDALAPAFARTVDIHRKPGYDPVEMFINMPERETPLDATLVKGTHGYPADDPARRGILVCSDQSALQGKSDCRDIDVTPLILRNFGVEFQA